MKKSMIIDIISGGFIFLFVYAAISKVMDMDKFAAQIGQSPIFTSVSYPIAWAVLAIEVIVSIMLAWRRYRLAGLHAALLLMSLFTFYILVILSFSKNIPCSCGGVLQKLGWGEHLAFNIFFVGLAILGIRLHQKLSQSSTNGTI